MSVMISKINGNKNLALLPIALCFYFLAIVLHRSFDKKTIHIAKQDSIVNFNHDFVRIFSTGNKMLISDVLWVQTLLESDLERYAKRDLGNWMYLRFLTISALDPLFYQNYLYGGMYLSIIKDDVKAAAIIYEKGLKHYPDSYELLYNAGFNYYFELGDAANGLRLLEKIVGHPKAPPQIASTVHKLKIITGVDKEVVLSMVKERLSVTQEPSLQNKLKGDIFALQSEIDLECLNGGKMNCNQIDLYGSRYIRIGGRYKSQTDFKPYSLFLKNKMNIYRQNAERNAQP